MCPSGARQQMKKHSQQDIEVGDLVMPTHRRHYHLGTGIVVEINPKEDMISQDQCFVNVYWSAKQGALWMFEHYIAKVEKNES